MHVVRGGQRSRNRMRRPRFGVVRPERFVRWRERVPEVRERHGLRRGELLGNDVHLPKNMQRHRDLLDAVACHNELRRVCVRCVELQDELRGRRGLRERLLLRKRRLRRQESERQCVHGDKPVHKRQLRRRSLLQRGVRRNVPVVQTRGVDRNVHQRHGWPRPRQRVRGPGRGILRHNRLLQRRGRVPEVLEQHSLCRGELLGDNVHLSKNVRRLWHVRDPFAFDDELRGVCVRRNELQILVYGGFRLCERQLLRERRLHGQKGKRKRVHRDESMFQRQLRRRVLLQLIVRRLVPIVQARRVARNLLEHP